MERDINGHIQVSKIETEKLISHYVKIELENRKLIGNYQVF